MTSAHHRPLFAVLLIVTGVFARNLEAAPKRPQTPEPPFPYASSDLVIPGTREGISLAATLFTPEGSGPFPAVVLVTGSGPQDRDETILGHKPFLVLADNLARRGIAVLRYDDRGVGSSTGDLAQATTLDFADDADAVFSWLASQAFVDSRRVGIIGHSEGGLIASIVASRNSAVAFIVLLAGPGLRGDELLLLQNAALAKAMGASSAQIETARSLNATLYAAAIREQNPVEAATAVREAYSNYVASAPGLSKLARKAALKQTDSIVASLTTPWMRTFLALDPACYLVDLRIPVLALNGSKDLQVPPDENLAALAHALPASAPLTALRLEGLNHLFQHAKTGLPSEYEKIEETFAPEALAAIGDWIVRP